MPSIADKLAAINKSICDAAHAAGRDPADIKLIAVTKTKPIQAILDAYGSGQTVFGENYAQELRDKVKEIESVNSEAFSRIEWHFLGHLQKNKVKYVAPVAKWIHSINSVELAEAIDKRAPAPINSLIEINIASEESKMGTGEDKLFELIAGLRDLKNIRLKGLMCMPPYSDDPEANRPHFRRLADLIDEINKSDIYPERLTELSMGMTQDFEVAIEEGATIVRIGTAIFGERNRV